jgi:ankyrin repeat protein
MKCHSDVVKLLLANGADVNARDDVGWTPLMSAQYDNEVVKLILDAGAEINAKNNDGRTALMLAAEDGETQIVSLLLTKDNAINTKDQWGRTALAWSAYNGHADVVNALLTKGAHFEVRDNTGQTALMLAAENGHSEVVKILLAAGADVNAKEWLGATAQGLASEKGHADVVKLLKANQAKELNHDNPEGDGPWLQKIREQVEDYLKRESVTHGRISDCPAWHVAPYISIWAVESLKHPGRVGWWVVSGDCPTDYVSADALKHPRDVMRAIGNQWLEVAEHMSRGEKHPTITIGTSDEWSQLEPLLRARAELLAQWAEDDSVWDE